MLYRFRICPEPDQPDITQGWVIISNEIAARKILGKDVHLVPMPKSTALDVPIGSVFVADGSLALA